MTPLAARYTGRHVREARHGAWVNKKRSFNRRPSAQVLPAAAAMTVAGLLVGGASAAIGMSPVSNSAQTPFYDPADIPPPDPGAGAVPRSLTPVHLTEQAAYAPANVVGTGSCEVSYKNGGQTTASGEAFDPAALTAAHESLPFNTLVKLTNSDSGASVVVRVNDRGPYYGDRCFDLTSGAFASIADPSAGVVDVRYEILAADAT